MSIKVDNLVNLCQTYINSISNRVEPSDWYTFITSAIREIRRGRTFPSQRRNTSLDVFSGVFTYTLPADFSSFIKPHDSLFEQSDQGPYLVYGRDKDFFANNKYGLALTQNANNKYLMVRQDGYANTLLDTFENDLTTYVAAGDANTVVANNYDYKEGGGALQFNITSNIGVASINVTLEQAVDITEYVDQNGSVFFWVKLPTVVDSVSIDLSSSGGYYSFTGATTDFLGNALAVGWNLVRFEFKNAIVNAVPDKTAITSYAISLNHTGVTASGFELDALYLRLPSVMELPYNSKYIVTDELGAYKEAVTLGSDYVLIDEDYEEMIAYKSVEHGAKWKFGDADVEKMAASEYEKAYKEFSRRFPSVEAPIQSNYYRRNRF